VRLLQERFGTANGQMEAIGRDLEAIRDPDLLQDLLVEAARTESLDAFLDRLRSLA